MKIIFKCKLSNWECDGENCIFMKESGPIWKQVRQGAVLARKQKLKWSSGIVGKYHME